MCFFNSQIMWTLLCHTWTTNPTHVPAGTYNWSLSISFQQLKNFGFIGGGANYVEGFCHTMNLGQMSLIGLYFIYHILARIGWIFYANLKFLGWPKMLTHISLWWCDDDTLYDGLFTWVDYFGYVVMGNLKNMNEQNKSFELYIRLWYALLS